MSIRIVCLLLAGAAWAQDQPAGWSPFARLQEARADACAVRLGSGRVLVSGGTGADGPLASAETLDADGTVRSAASMSTQRSRHGCTLLGDGRVLVSGGGAAGGEVYDPAADAWTAIAGSGAVRSGATATRLLDGRVLIAGGSGADGSPLATLKIFDPNANTLTALDAVLGEARRDHAAALLDGGRVILAGGDNGSGPTGSTDIFDPASGAISAGPPLNLARAGHSATVLEDGRVLVAGGLSGESELDSAELLDAGGAAWTLTAARLNTARSGHFAALVPGNGGVLLGGGSAGGQALAATELFQPANDAFVALGSLTAPRAGLAAAALDDGVMLAMGGVNSDGPQSACGVLALTALTFSRTLYHPGETVLVSGSDFPAGATVTFTLDLLQGTTATAVSNRLITTSAAVSAAAKLPGGFPQVPVVAVAAADAGRQFRLTAHFGSSSIVRTVPAKLPTMLAVIPPAPVLEGQSATFAIEVRRTPAPGPVTGTVAFTFGSLSAVLPVNGTGTPVALALPLQGLAAGTLPVTATYSGDSLNAASTATSSYSVTSKSPLVELTSSLDSPSVGTPFTLFTRVHLGGPAAGAPPFTGTATISDSGTVIGTAKVVTSLGSPNPDLLTSFQYTPLSFAPLRFSAGFAGDAVYRGGASATVSPLVQQAQPTIRLFLTTAPAGQSVQFLCGAPTPFGVSLAFPPAIGLSNRNFHIDTAAGDGSVRTIAGAAAGATLTPSVAQPGTATGAASVTVPFNALLLTAVFDGDLFLKPARQTLPASMQPVTVNAQFVNLQAAAANPVTLQVSVANSVPAGCAVNGPEGTVEFFDGAASLGIVQLPPNTIPVSQIVDGTSNTIIFAESMKQARLLVSRPAGVRNLKARYSGDAFHASAETPVVAVTFQ